jgi:uncharacterized protein YcnI
MFRTLTTTALFAVTAAATTPAFAHVTLEVQEAPVGSTYKAVLRVPHGCEGEATHTLRVLVPEGMIGVKPMPKAGWTLETVTGAYGQTYEQYGAQVSEGVVEIVWTGELLDSHDDEFVFRGSLAGVLEPGTTLYFPVIQECATGTERWIEMPAAGQSSDDLALPAPGLHLVPARGGH